MKLPIDKYTLLNTAYVPLVDSSGTCCHNCGRLISNIATLQNSIGETYIVGLDCAKTLLTKEVYEVAKLGITTKKRLSAKIKHLKAIGKPFVLNEQGMPCYPPESRSGYYIPI